MKNLLLIIATFVATAISAQDLSVSIQETYFGGVAIQDSTHIFKVLDMKATGEEWDAERPDINFDKEFEFYATYGKHSVHTWTEEGVYVVFCTKDGEIMGEDTYFIINEKYVDYVVSYLPGIMIKDTFVRTDTEWIAGSADHLVVVR